ncbi:MAG TPA: PaaI family thioesterase, partial [Clostridia bacterium]|nr:PaaI family thioesterase [Clostridia bacterium]
METEKKNAQLCFGCGQDNPIGLKLSFYREGDLFCGEFMAQEEHQGYPGMVHGGIIATLLDEIMANNLFDQGLFVVTAEITVRYVHKVPVGERIFLFSRQLDRRRRLYEMEGWIEDDQGRVLAQSRGKM